MGLSVGAFLMMATSLGDPADSLSNGPSRKGSTFSVSTGRAASVTPSSSHHHNLSGNNSQGESAPDLNRTPERDHQPHSCSDQSQSHGHSHSHRSKHKSSHHHSLDRDGNNKTYSDVSLRQFYNTNPKPHSANCYKKQPHQTSRQSVPLKNVVKSRSNQSNSSLPKMEMNGSEEYLNGDRLSISSHCSNATADGHKRNAEKSNNLPRFSKPYNNYKH